MLASRHRAPGAPERRGVLRDEGAQGEGRPGVHRARQPADPPDRRDLLGGLIHEYFRVAASPATAHPDSAWVTQQARNLALDLDSRASPVRFLIRDRDAKFRGLFDTVLRSEGMRVIITPIQAPNANAHAERVIETIRTECLDWTLILGRRHLDRTLRTYVDHYNRQRPHRALGLASPLAEASITVPIPVSPHDVRVIESGFPTPTSFVYAEVLGFPLYPSGLPDVTRCRVQCFIRRGARSAK